MKNLVDLSAHNTQELVDVKFAFIEGVPPRDVHSRQPIWADYQSYNYGLLAIDTLLKAKNIELSELMSKLGYKFGAWYDFPKSKNFGEKYDYIFRIDVIDNGKIECVFKRRGDSYGSIERFKMTKEEFTNFLNHPELFS